MMLLRYISSTIDVVGDFLFLFLQFFGVLRHFIAEQRCGGYGKMLELTYKKLRLCICKAFSGCYNNSGSTLNRLLCLILLHFIYIFLYKNYKKRGK